MAWGSKEEKLKFCVAHMIKKFIPEDKQFLCDKDFIEDAIEAHDALLTDAQLDTLVATLNKDYIENINAVKREVTSLLERELLIVEGCTK